MNWNVVLTDFRASVPPGASLREKAVWLPVTAFLNSKSEKLDCNFKVTLGGEDNSLSTSDDLESTLDLGGKLFGTLRQITLGKDSSIKLHWEENRTP